MLRFRIFIVVNHSQLILKKSRKIIFKKAEISYIFITSRTQNGTTLSSLFFKKKKNKYAIHAIGQKSDPHLMNLGHILRDIFMKFGEFQKKTDLKKSTAKS